MCVCVHTYIYTYCTHMCVYACLCTCAHVGLIAIDADCVKYSNLCLFRCSNSNRQQWKKEQSSKCLVYICLCVSVVECLCACISLHLCTRFHLIIITVAVLNS